MDMYKYIVSYLLSILVCCKFSNARYEFSLSTAEVTWDNAHESCEQIGSMLLNPSIRSQITSEDIPSGESFWTRNYFMKTQFYWRIGCYVIGDNLQSTSVDLEAENSLASCSSHCENPQYIGLEGTQCHCFESNPTFGQQSTNACVAKCPGNEQDICGQSRQLVMYRMYTDDDHVDDMLDKRADDCVAVNKPSDDYDYYPAYDVDSNTTETFSANPCTQLNGYVCESDKMTGDVYTVHEKKVTWFAANRLCSESGKRLAFIAGSNVLGFFDRIDVLSGTSYWIGLYRQVFESSGNVKTAIRPYRCQVVKNTGEGIVTEQEVCRDSRRSFCQTDVPDLDTTPNIMAGDTTDQVQVNETSFDIVNGSNTIHSSSYVAFLAAIAVVYLEYRNKL